MWTPIQKRFHKKLRDTFTKNALFPAPWSSRRTSLSASVPPRPRPSRRRPPYASLPRASSHTDDPSGDGGGDPAGPHPHPSQPPAVAGPPSSPDPAVKSVPSHQPHALAHAASAASEAAGGSVHGSPAAGSVSHDASQMRRSHGSHSSGGGGGGFGGGGGAGSGQSWKAPAAAAAAASASAGEDAHKAHPGRVGPAGVGVGDCRTSLHLLLPLAGRQADTDGRPASGGSSGGRGGEDRGAEMAAKAAATGRREGAPAEAVRSAAAGGAKANARSCSVPSVRQPCDECRGAAAAHNSCASVRRQCSSALLPQQQPQPVHGKPLLPAGTAPWLLQLAGELALAGSAFTCPRMQSERPSTPTKWRFTPSGRAEPRPRTPSPSPSQPSLQGSSMTGKRRAGCCGQQSSPDGPPTARLPSGSR